MAGFAGNMANVSSVMAARPTYMPPPPQLQSQFTGSPLHQPPSHHQLCSNNLKQNSTPFFNCHAPQSTAGSPVLFPSPQFSSQVNLPQTVEPSCVNSQSQHQQFSQMNTALLQTRLPVTEMVPPEQHQQQRREKHEWFEQMSELNAATNTMTIDAESQHPDVSHVIIPGTVCADAPWQHQVPRSVPWSVVRPPTFKSSTHQDGSLGNYLRYNQIGGRSKRKAESSDLPCKQFISEEKMAAKMRDLRISDQSPSSRNHISPLEAWKVLQEIDDRLDIEEDEVEETCQQEAAPVLSIDHPELKEKLEQTWKTSKKLLPTHLLKQVHTTCTDLVLWQQPSNFVEKIIRDSSLSKHLPTLSMDGMTSFITPSSVSSPASSARSSDASLINPSPLNHQPIASSSLTQQELGHQHVKEPQMDTDGFLLPLMLNTVPGSSSMLTEVGAERQDLMDLQDDDL